MAINLSGYPSPMTSVLFGTSLGLDKILVARQLARLVVSSTRLVSILSRAELTSQLGSLTSQLDTSSN
jgi:hypothetical protein